VVNTSPTLDAEASTITFKKYRP